jgi:hypothetical protein
MTTIPFTTKLFTVRLEERCVPNAVIPEEPVKPEWPAEPPLDPVVLTTTTATPATPPAETALRFAVGSGPGQTGLVNVYSNRTNALLTSYTPFGTAYTGGVRVATADFTGDGIDDVAAATATGSPRVVVFDGQTGKAIANIAPWQNGSGAFVAAGDINGDGRADLVVGSGTGRTPEVTIYSGTNLSAPAIRTFTPSQADANFGVRVAAGDLTGDGRAEVVTASKNSAVIHTLTMANTATSANRRGAVLKGSSAPQVVRGLGTAADTAGVFVAIGDFTGTGRMDIAAGFSANGIARVRVVNGTNTGQMVMTSFGLTQVPAGGVPVAFRDITGTGKQALIAAGGNGTSQVRVLNATVGGLARSFMSMTPSYQGGVFVG